MSQDSLFLRNKFSSSIADRTSKKVLHRFIKKSLICSSRSWFIFNFNFLLPVSESSFFSSYLLHGLFIREINLSTIFRNLLNRCRHTGQKYATLWWKPKNIHAKLIKTHLTTYCKKDCFIPQNSSDSETKKLNFAK